MNELKECDIVRSLREAKSLTRKELAEIIGVPVQTIANYELGDRTPSFEYIKKLGETFQVNMSYLFYGKGEMFSNNEPSQSTAINNDDFIHVPMLDDVKASAGVGYIVTDESSSRTLIFRKDWVKKNGINGKSLSAIHVTGDSMTPTLNSGDALLIDHSQTSPIQDRIFAIQSGDGLVVKRMGEFRDNKITLISDNKTISDRVIELDDNFKIVGRVVWFGRTI